MMLIAFYAMWETLQSSWVAGKISGYATKYAKEVLNTDIKFESMNFKLFPPGAELNNVVILSHYENIDVSFKSKSLGVYFNPLDIFNTSFQIESIDIFDASVMIDLIQFESTKEKQFKSKVDFNAILQGIPTNRIQANNFLVKLNEKEIFVQELYLERNKNKINYSVSVEHLKLNQFLDTNLLIDSISAEGVIDKREIKLNEGLIQKDLVRINCNGRVRDYFGKDLNYKIKSKINLPLESLHEYLKFDQVGKIEYGQASVSINASGNLDEYKADVEVEGQNIISDFAYGEKINLNFSINNQQMKITELQIRDKSQKLDLLKPFEFFNFETKKWVEEPIFIRANKLKTNNFLRYLRKNLGMIEGELSGDIKFVLGDNYYSFDVENEVLIDSFELIPGGTKILGFEDFKLQDAIFRVENGLFTMNMLMAKGVTKLQLVGQIGNNEFNIKMPQGKIDLSEISPIVNFPVDGIGDLGFDIYKTPANETEMRLKLKGKDFSFDSYPADEIDGDLLFSFEESKIEIKNINASVGQSKISINGELDYKDLIVDTDYQVSAMGLSELKLVLDKHLKNQDIPSNLFYGNIDSKGKIKGRLTANGIDVKGSVSGKNNYIFNEGVDRFALNYHLKNGQLQGNEFVIQKATGQLISDFKYELKTNDFLFESSVVSLPLVELSYYANTPLNLVGSLNGKVALEFKKGKLTGTGGLSLRKSSVLSEPYPNSYIDFEYGDKILKSKVNLFEGEIVLQSDINVLSVKERSKLKIDLDIPKFKKVVGLFKGVDVFSQELEGEIKYNAEAEFDWKNVKFYSFYSNLKFFKLKKGPVDVFYFNNSPEIEVEKSKIKKWNVNVRGKKFYFISKGDGDFNNYFDLVSNIKIDASIVEVFNSVITKANGNIRGRLSYSESMLGETYEAYVTSNDLSVSTSFLPTSISNTNMRLSFVNNLLEIENFKSQISNGFLTLKGGINFSNIVPDINVRFDFKDAGISIMKKSNLLFSGNGSLIGKTFPYTLGGDIYIQKLIFVNEFTDFAGGDSSAVFEEVKYLPSEKVARRDNLLDMNINIITREPVFIKNSMADIGFSGSVQVLGSEKEPKLNGKISLATRNNKINFKNNEFVLSKGNIFFYEKNKVINPELDFQATSTINQHKINVEVVGPVKKFDFNLSSEPALSQSDILSLIAFGYTDDISNNLSDAEKESMTRASVGSLIFDSFKINETLKNEFGLQVNLGTEINREERSYLSQRGGESNNQTTGVTSATTFELKKQLSDAMSLSVSSTVGDSVSQRQSVNLNYNVDKKVSIEGVYESNTTDDSQTINDANSFGADLKVKWSFK